MIQAKNLKIPEQSKEFKPTNKQKTKARAKD